MPPRNPRLALAEKHCTPCHAGTPSLLEGEIIQRLKQIKGWKYADGFLQKNFPFKNYHHTIAFVNATAWISHRENHHPDLEVHYNRCKVSYHTHAINGISENDFICAAKIEKLLSL